jgi:hypothetical protein
MSTQGVWEHIYCFFLFEKILLDKIKNNRFKVKFDMKYLKLVINCEILVFIKITQIYHFHDLKRENLLSDDSETTTNIFIEASLVL